MEQATKTATKFCEDCALFRPAAGGGNATDHRCAFPRAAKGIALVTREAAKSLRFCGIERANSDEDSCGPDAKWFEPKPASAAEAA